MSGRWEDSWHCAHAIDGKQKQKDNLTDLHHLHLKIADTIDAITEPAAGAQLTYEVKKHSRTKQRTEDGRPESARIPTPPAKMLVNFCGIGS
jgi:hypothetical protein